MRGSAFLTVSLLLAGVRARGDNESPDGVTVAVR
jgi:hypothetical protein